MTLRTYATLYPINQFLWDSHILHRQIVLNINNAKKIISKEKRGNNAFIGYYYPENINFSMYYDILVFLFCN